MSNSLQPVAKQGMHSYLFIVRTPLIINARIFKPCTDGVSKKDIDKPLFL